MKNLLTSFLLIITLSSCHFDPTIEYRVDPELTPYVEKFFSEGQKRGIILERENLVVIIYDGLEKDENVWGLSTKEGKQRVILIDKDYFEFNRDNGNPLRNESIIFHELGHAILGRGHCTGGDSIMDITSCFYTYCYTGDVGIIDELFTPSTCVE